jgi:hypothetical protein
VIALPKLRALRAVVDAVDRIPGRFSPELAARACSVGLHKIAGSNPHMLEFESHSASELFSTVSLRVPLTGSGPAGILVMTPHREPSFGQGDVARIFSLSPQCRGIDVWVPPEGAITYSEVTCQRLVLVQLAIRPCVLRSLIVHDEVNVVEENIRPAASPTQSD